MYAQLPVDPPDSLQTLQWVVIAVLVSALIYIFKAWQSDRRECQDQRAELLEKTLTGLADVREVLSGLAVVIENTKEQYEIFQAIQDILRRLDRHEKSD
jgi:hypothetical protein